MKRIKAAVLVLIGAVSFSAGAYACAPDFDSAYFVRNTKEHYLAIPEGDFLFELKRIGGDKKPMAISEGVSKRVADADIDDLQKALKERKVSGKEFDDAVASYRAARDSINSFLEACPVEDSSLWYGGRFRSQERVKMDMKNGKLDVEIPQPKWYGWEAEAPAGFNKTDAKSYPEPAVKLSPKVPEEFRLYLSGAVKYHFNDFKSAIQEWQKILDFPEGERKYKSTWAAFMIGKSYLSFRDQAKAVPYFIKTRELAGKKFSDSLDLVSESYGWQALAEYEKKDYVSGIKHYLKTMDVNSLNWLCGRVSEMKDGSIEKIVKDDTARSVLLG